VDSVEWVKQKEVAGYNNSSNRDRPMMSQACLSWMLCIVDCRENTESSQYQLCEKGYMLLFMYVLYVQVTR